MDRRQEGAPLLLAGFPAGLAVWLSVRLDGRPVLEEPDLAKAPARAAEAEVLVVDARDDPSRAAEALTWSPGAPVVLVLARHVEAPPGVAAALRHPLDREKLVDTLRDILAARARPHGGGPDLHDLARPMLEERILSLERRLAAVLSGRLPRDALAQSAPQAHALVGSLGVLGYLPEARDALEAEALLKDPRRADLERLAQLLRHLRGALARPRPPPRHGAAARGRVLAVASDPALLREWALLGAALELQVTPCPPERAMDLLAREPPDVLLVDDEDVPRPLVASALSSRPIVPVVLRTSSGGVDLPGVRSVPRERSPAAALTLARDSIPPRTLADLGTVLVVDDDPMSLAYLRRLVETVGGHAVAMADPAEALGALGRISPAAIIVDLQMEPIDGEEFARMVRRDPRWRDVPLLCVTGDDSQGTRRRILAAGVDDVLVKPPVVDVLRARLRSLLRAPHLVDPASGVPTAATLETLAPSLIDIARRETRPLSLVTILSRAGNGATLARRLRDRLPREHFVARVGPNEVVVLAYGLPPPEARALVAAHAPGEIAIGVAAHPPHATLPALLDAARRDADSGEVGEWSVSPAAAGGGRHVDVAIVEEDGLVAGVLAKALEDGGMTTRWFADGAEAAAMLAGPSPPVEAAVVLTEVSLPGLDGFSLLRALRETRPRPRVIVVTTRASEVEILQAFELGAFDHVAKPFSLPVLLHRVRRAREA